MSIPVVAKFELISDFKNSESSPIELPRRATPGSAGYDFYVPKGLDITLQPGGVFVVSTGIKCRIEEGWVLKLYPRSGLGFKYQVGIANTVGVIDSDYYNNPDNEGEICVKLVNRGNKEVVIPAGKAYCQGVFVPYGITEDDSPVNPERVGGFGSSDNQKGATT